MISMHFCNRKGGPPQILEAVPLLPSAHIMASGDTCPQGTSNPCRLLKVLAESHYVEQINAG
jgi:hypothetical protein